MKNFKVIALNVTGVSGKVHYAKEVLNENQLGGLAKANEWVEKGFVEEIKTEKKEESKKVEEPKKEETKTPNKKTK